jgi:hypothetical protein
MTLVAIATTLLIPAGALAATLKYTRPQRLPGSPPKGEAQGGEPSAVFDHGGRFVYVVGARRHGPRRGLLALGSRRAPRDVLRANPGRLVPRRR